MPTAGPVHSALLKVGGDPGDGDAEGVGLRVGVGVGVPPITVELGVAVGVAVRVGVLIALAVGVGLGPPCAMNWASRFRVVCCAPALTREDVGPQGEMSFKAQSH